MLAGGNELSKGIEVVQWDLFDGVVDSGSFSTEIFADARAIRSGLEGGPVIDHVITSSAEGLNSRIDD